MKDTKFKLFLEGWWAGFLEFIQQEDGDIKPTYSTKEGDVLSEGILLFDTMIPWRD